MKLVRHPQRRRVKAHLYLCILRTNIRQMATTQKISCAVRRLTCLVTPIRRPMLRLRIARLNRRLLHPLSPLHNSNAVKAQVPHILVARLHNPMAQIYPAIWLPYGQVQQATVTRLWKNVPIPARQNLSRVPFRQSPLRRLDLYLHHSCIQSLKMPSLMLRIQQVDMPLPSCRQAPPLISHQLVLLVPLISFAVLGLHCQCPLRVFESHHMLWACSHPCLLHMQAMYGPILMKRPRNHS